MDVTTRSTKQQPRRGILLDDETRIEPVGRCKRLRRDISKQDTNSDLNEEQWQSVHQTSTRVAGATDKISLTENQRELGLTNECHQQSEETDLKEIHEISKPRRKRADGIVDSSLSAPRNDSVGRQSEKLCEVEQHNQKKLATRELQEPDRQESTRDVMAESVRSSIQDADVVGKGGARTKTYKRSRIKTNLLREESNSDDALNSNVFKRRQAGIQFHGLSSDYADEEGVTSAERNNYKQHGVKRQALNGRSVDVSTAAIMLTDQTYEKNLETKTEKIVEKQKLEVLTKKKKVPTATLR